MTSNKLKAIAFVAMLIDHVYIIYPMSPLIFRWIGRISAPIFIFCTVHSFTCTKNKKEYIFRLYIASVTMGFLHTIREWHELYPAINGNIFRLLFSISVILYILELFLNKNKNAKKYILLYVIYNIVNYSTLLFLDRFVPYEFGTIRDIIHFLLPAITGSSLNLEYGYIFVILSIIIYLCKDNKKDLITYYSYFCLFYLWVTTSNVLQYFNGILPHILNENIMGFKIRYSGQSMFRINYQWAMIFALPLILLYNKKKGKNLKYFYYIAYPAHLILFSIISMFI